MRDYDHSVWYSFAAPIAWANVRARTTGHRQRVECIPPDTVLFSKFAVVPAKPPVVTA
jgi:hypothetical protein